MFKRRMNFLFFLNNRGEAGAGGDDGKGKAGSGDPEKKFTQQQLDHEIGERLARERSKYQDYEDLKKFRDEHSKQIEQQKQADLERQKDYEKAKENYENKIKEMSGVIGQKDSQLKDLTISHTLSSELSSQNAYLEESLALLKTRAVFDTDGSIKIKGKDSNGLDSLMPVTDGVKQFLTQRPHLVKATSKPGAGVGGGTGASHSGAGGETLAELNVEYQKAYYAGDMKKAAELKAKMKAGLTAQQAAFY